MRDRDVCEAIWAIAANRINEPAAPLDASEDILDIRIDAMDQAKFKLPKHEANKGKTAQSMWRPQLHVTGVTIAGLREYFLFVFMSSS